MFISTLPETNIAPENRPSHSETSIPTIHFQVLCQFQGGYIHDTFFSRVFDLMSGCHVPSVYHTIGTVGTGSAKKNGFNCK